MILVLPSVLFKLTLDILSAKLKIVMQLNPMRFCSESAFFLRTYVCHELKLDHIRRVGLRGLMFVLFLMYEFYISWEVFSFLCDVDEECPF